MPPTGRHWRFTKEKFEEALKDKRIIFGRTGQSKPQYKRFKSEAQEKGVNVSTIWDDVDTATGGTQELMSIFNGEKVFETPKPVGLVEKIIKISTDKNSIILDSFAGSGTTAHAVLDLNKEDGGNRKFILVEMEDYADKITAERVRRVIKGGLGGSFSYIELGGAIDTGDILSGKRLPSFTDMARYVFYTATGKNIDEKKIREASGFIGETDEHEVYLLYKPNLEYLKTTALDLEKAKVIAKGKSKKRRLVFAPAKYLDQDALDEFRIDFAQLPFGVYKI
mgnify:FL=1